MSKSKEKLLKKQAAREAKREEEIRNGTVRRVTYEGKEKKPSLPNRLCPFVTPEEEMEDRQETVEKAVMIYQRMLSNLLPKLACIKDPRNPLKIKHKISVLLIYGILMSMYMIGSRREANRILSGAVFFDNLKAMFPELRTMPHADTVARLLEKINVDQIQECMVGLLKDLIRSKKFKNYLHNKHFLIAIDGTQKFCRNYQWAPECLERQVGGEEKSSQYYCYVLEAAMILDNGIVLPVISEFIENGKHEKDESKQDCETEGILSYGREVEENLRTYKAINCCGWSLCVNSHFKI